MTGEPSTIYVFGCFDRVDGSNVAGHYLYTSARHKYPPDVPTEIQWACDGKLTHPQPEGGIARTTPPAEGWSYVSWYDRQGDARGGSSTGILARGEWTPEQMITAGRRLAPWAFRVDVQP